MKRFLLPSALCLLVLAPLGLAQAPPTPPTAPELYKRAVTNLDEGHWFESDIADLQEAVRQDPKNSACHLALGCAQVDRAGSLAYAASMTDQLQNDQAQYPKALAAWQAAQQDAASDDFGTPRPEPPPQIRFQTKDDLTTLHLSGKEAAARIIDLGRAAQREWAQSIALAPSIAERAQAENVQGWGLRYERVLLGATGYPEAKVQGAPKPEAVIAAFQAATKDAPGNALYWECLGDAYSDNDTSHLSETLHAWQKSLALAPGNNGLRYHLFQKQDKQDKKAALATLRTLAETDPDSAWVQYDLAALLFRQVHYSDVNDRDIDFKTPEEAAQKRLGIVHELAAKDDDTSRQIADDAVAALEQGNAANEVSPPGYVPPVPKVLRVAWNYWDRFEYDFSDWASLREMARAAGGYAQVQAAAGREDEAVRAARAGIGVGLRMAGDWPVEDAPQGHEIMDALVGLAVTGIGYKALVSVYTLCGDLIGAQQAQFESDAFRQQVQAYKDVLRQQMTAGHLYDNY